MSLPLEGVRVLVTRARKQASDLTDRLESLGAIPLVLPSIDIAPTTKLDQLDEALSHLSRYDWVVLTSVNGVAAVVERLDVLGIDRSSLAARKLAVIGPATGKALATSVRQPDLIPDRFVAEEILEVLPNVRGLKFLLARADLARKDLADELVHRGAIVDEVETYQIVRVQEGGEEVLNGPKPDVLTFTSSSGVRNTLERLRSAGKEEWMHEIPIVCIGPITASTVEELGYRVSATAEEFTIPGLVKALCHFSSKQEAARA